MRTILWGLLAGAGACLVTLAGLGLWDGHANAEDYITEPFAAFSTSLAGGFWMLTMFGPMVAMSGGLLGCGVGAAIVGLRRMGRIPAVGSEKALIATFGRRVVAVIMWGTSGVLLVLALAVGMFAVFAGVIDSDFAYRTLSKNDEHTWYKWMNAGRIIPTAFATGVGLLSAAVVLILAIRLRRQLLDRRLLAAGVRGGVVVLP
jgi:hypothetical protein